MLKEEANMANLGSYASMSPEVVSVLIGIGTFILTLSTTLFVVGTKWGETKTTLTSISERLARIEGMFEMKLKD